MTGNSWLMDSWMVVNEDLYFCFGASPADSAADITVQKGFRGGFSGGKRFVTPVGSGLKWRFGRFASGPFPV